MTGKEDCYRAAAIRALCTITDPVMLQVSILFYSKKNNRKIYKMLFNKP